ncbi:MAG: hypothetical protein J2P24_04780 [Streptosporangiales bacterium]|nr:hypothetical protein [Streptosporangiales bacterium]
MADGGSLPPTPPAARTLGPRIIAAALVVGVGVLVGVLLGPAFGGRTAAGAGSTSRPNATESPDEFENSSVPPNRAQALGDVRQLRMRVGGVNRTALVYRPPTARTGAPVFVAVHGFTSSAQAIVRHTSFVDLAERNGWIVAFPQGIRYADGQRAWNAGTCCGGAPTADTPDTTFIVELAHYVVDAYHANPKQLFYEGHSNGAMLGYRIACSANQPFAGFALLSGTLVSPCRSTSKVPILAMHGLQDGTVPFAGSRWRVSLQTRLEPVTETLDTVAALNGCHGALASRSPAAAEVRVFTSTCPRTATVALVTIRDMQHQWTESADRYGIDETRYSTTWLFEHTTA